MSKRKHTPGPWIFSPESGDKFADVTGNDGSKTGKLIGVLKSEPSLSEANGRLISAAPDLLEALKGIRERCNCMGPCSDCERAKIAIAKAEGKDH